MSTFALLIGGSLHQSQQLLSTENFPYPPTSHVEVAVPVERITHSVFGDTTEHEMKQDVYRAYYSNPVKQDGHCYFIYSFETRRGE